MRPAGFINVISRRVNALTQAAPAPLIVQICCFCEFVFAVAAPTMSYPSANVLLSSVWEYSVAFASQFIREKYWEYEYEEVVTPNMYNLDLWKTSGHADHYKVCQAIPDVSTHMPW